MHDLNSQNVAEDSIKIHITLQGRHVSVSTGWKNRENLLTLEIPGQLDEVVPLTPVQIYVKEEQFMRDQLHEVVPLSPVQIFLKEEEAVYCKPEEPELASLVPLLPKEGDVVNELPEDYEEGSGPLIINLENSSSEEWSNQSDPLAVEQNVANASYVEYVETSEPILMDLGTPCTEGSSHPLRITQEATSTVENGELYDMMGSEEVVPASKNDEAAHVGETDNKCEEITGVCHVPAKTFHCGYCKESFPTEGEMQMHTLSHTDRTAVWREVPEVKLKPKPIRTLRAQHTCGDCGESFERLEHLMRHRLGHIRAALRKPFGVPKLFSSPKPSDALQKSGVPQPQPQVSATPDSRRTVVAVSTKMSPKRSPQRAVTSQPKRWVRRKKKRRRRVS